MTRHVPEWVRTSDPVIRSPAPYLWRYSKAATNDYCISNQGLCVSYLRWLSKFATWCAIFFTAPASKLSSVCTLWFICRTWSASRPVLTEAIVRVQQFLALRVRFVGWLKISTLLIVTLIHISATDRKPESGNNPISVQKTQRGLWGLQTVSHTIKLLINEFGNTGICPHFCLTTGPHSWWTRDILITSRTHYLE